MVIVGDSDIKLKKNVTTIEDALQKITKLEGKHFYWRNTKDTRGNIGFMAREVEKVIPEVVQTNPITGYSMLEYDKLTALLVEGMKQQQKQIDTLEKELKSLKSRNK